MLGSSFAWGLAFVNIGMPPILGYMLSGVISGPFVMNIIGGDKYTAESIESLGEFGLLILMFVTGMHLDINTYTRNKSEILKPIKFTLLQVVYSMLFVLVITMIPFSVISSLIQNHSIKLFILLAASIVLYSKNRYFLEKLFRKPLTVLFLVVCIGIYIYLFIDRIRSIPVSLSTDMMKVLICSIAILSLNSTAISLKLLEIRDKKNSHIGRRITEILVAQDLTLIAFIILLKTLAGSASVLSIFFKVFSATALLFLVDILAKTNPNPLSDFIDYVAMNSKELPIIFVSSFGLFFAFICEYIGLSDIYGAFIAGMILGNLYQGSYIEKKCKPIKDIFVTLFFVYVGTLMNLRAVFEKLPTVILINLIIIAFKYISNYYINRQINRPDRQMTQSCMILSSLLLTQVSEFSFLLISTASTGIDESSPLGAFLNLLSQSCIVSLTFGCLVTVLAKRFLYYNKTIV